MKNRRQEDIVEDRHLGGKSRGYGWPATLELLSLPIGKPVDSRQLFKMIICPACNSFHESGGKCPISRHRHFSTPAIPSLAVNRLPRSLFFQSQFFANLNTTSFSFSSPLLGSTVMGNDNARELNARTIQQLMAANLTLLQAWTWIDQLTRANDTGNLAAFALIVTGEIYTVGFDSMVLNVLPNVTVENSGNASLPPPPIRAPSFWEAVWNSFTGLVSTVWNAVVAVATFVANVAMAAVRWCMDFAVAIASGDGLTFFYNTVVKPFVDAVLAFVSWIVDLAIAAFNIIFAPVIRAFKGCASDVTNAAAFMFNRKSLSPIESGGLETFQSFLNMLLTHGFFYIILGLFIAIRIIGAMIACVLAGLSDLTQKAATIFMGAIAGLISGVSIGGTMAGVAWLVGNILYYAVPGSSELWREARAVTIAGLSFSVLLYVARRFGTGTETDAAGIYLSILGLVLGFAALAVQGNVWMSFLLAATGLIVAGISAVMTWRDITKVAHFADDDIPNVFEFVPSSFSLIALLVAVANLGNAAANIQKEVGPP